MRNIQRLCILIAAAALLLLPGGTANAFWGFGDPGQQDKSGLDLERGYDRNTVVKISGPVAVPPRPFDGGLMTFDIALPGEQIVVVLGPAWYLQDDNLDWKIGEQVTVRGSLAQGKDGRTYLLSQQISTPDGATIELRSDNGTPSWSGGRRGGQQGGGSGGQHQRGGGPGGRRGR
ncbi:MAG: DNA-binding protein [Syntrophales bacterium]